MTWHFTMVWCTPLQHAKHGPPEGDERSVFLNSPSTSQSYRARQHLHQWVNVLYPWHKRDTTQDRCDRWREWVWEEKDGRLDGYHLAIAGIRQGILTSLSVQSLISHLWGNIMVNLKCLQFKKNPNTFRAIIIHVEALWFDLPGA